MVQSNAFQPEVINLTPLFSDDADAKRELAGKIGAVAASQGAFYVSHHGVDAALFQALEDESRWFFNLDEESKKRCYIGSSSNHRGYVPLSEKGQYADEGSKRLYEAFDLAKDLSPDDPDYGSADKLLGPNVWPERTAFREAVNRYYETVETLSNALCEAFATYLGQPSDVFSAQRRKPNSQLRLLHYLENEFRDDKAPSQMGAHTDYECFTILHQVGEGLQVLQDGEWRTAPVIDGTLVIMIGDTFEAWTNGRFRAVLHRVLNTGRERYSFPFFAAADFDAVIEPLTNGNGNAAGRYEPMVAGHHLLGQLFRDFPYLKRKRLEEGCWPEVPVPENNPFEVARRQGAGRV